MPAYGFNADDARRIAEIVRAAEHGRIGRNSFGVDSFESSKPGVRLLIAKHNGGAWATDATATVTIYNGDVGNIASAATVVAYNQYITFGDDPPCTSRWVALGHNGYNWIPVDSQDDCSECVSEIGGINFSVFPGYSNDGPQILGHDGSGCVKWYDVFTCATAAA